MNVMICFMRTEPRSPHTRCIICLSVKCLDVLFSPCPVQSMRCFIVAMFRLHRGPGIPACHRTLQPSPIQSRLNLRSRSCQVSATTCFSQGGPGASQRWVNILKDPSSSLAATKVGIYDVIASYWRQTRMWPLDKHGAEAGSGPGGGRGHQEAPDGLPRPPAAPLPPLRLRSVAIAIISESEMWIHCVV